MIFAKSVKLVSGGQLSRMYESINNDHHKNGRPQPTPAEITP
jgi:hypothetical protein